MTAKIVMDEQNIPNGPFLGAFVEFKKAAESGVNGMQIAEAAVSIFLSSVLTLARAYPDATVEQHANGMIGLIHIALSEAKDDIQAALKKETVQ